MTIRSTAIALIACFAAVPALAQTAPVPAPTTPPAVTPIAAPSEGHRWQACVADVQKFCATAEKGKGMLRACLTSHATELSDGCKTGMAEHANHHDGKTQ